MEEGILEAALWLGFVAQPTQAMLSILGESSHILVGVGRPEGGLFLPTVLERELSKGSLDF